MAKTAKHSLSPAMTTALRRMMDRGGIIGAHMLHLRTAAALSGRGLISPPFFLDGLAVRWLTPAGFIAAQGTRAATGPHAMPTLGELVEQAHADALTTEVGMHVVRLEEQASGHWSYRCTKPGCNAYWAPFEAYEIVTAAEMHGVIADDSPRPGVDVEDDGDAADITADADDDRDVHTEHCCKRHGCKYGQGSRTPCTVASGEKRQSFPCQRCEDDPDVTAIAETERVINLDAARTFGCVDTDGHPSPSWLLGVIAAYVLRGDAPRTGLSEGSARAVLARVAGVVLAADAHYEQAGGHRG